MNFAIAIHPGERFGVDLRELHEALESKRQFGNWVDEKLAQFVEGQDFEVFSGREIVPEDEWEQGFWSRMNGMAKYYLAQTPAGDFMSLPPQRQNEALPDWAKTLLNVPGMKAVVALDNDPLAADFWRRVDDQETIARKARGMRGPLAQKATSLLSKLETIKADARTPEESAKIDILRGWQNGVYDDAMNVLRASAAGMEDLGTEGAVDLMEQSAKTTLEMVGQIER